MQLAWYFQDDEMRLSGAFIFLSEVMKMKINLENCIRNQKDFDFHPEFWKKPECEIIAFLGKCVANWKDYIAECEVQPIDTTYKACCAEWAEKYKGFIKIITAA